MGASCGAPSGAPVTFVRSSNPHVAPSRFEAGKREFNATKESAMNSTALVPVFTGELAGQPTPLCNARDLHAFLQVGRDFSNWIKDRIDNGRFIEGEDYSPNLANRSDGRAGKRRTDYHLTIDTAKHLSLLENNAIGDQVRRYFIAIEKKAKAPASPDILLLQAHQTVESYIKQGRWVLSFDKAGMMNLHELPQDSVELPVADFARYIGDAGGMVPRSALAGIINAAASRLAR